MAYTKRGFTDGNVLYAHQLIAMEDAIIKNENDIKNIELTPGEDGITPHIGENGNWFIGDTDTGVRAEGKDGQDGSGGSSLNVYSTEEIVVGTWYNGKPVYRRTFIGVFPSTAGTLSIDATPVYDDIVSQYGYFDKVYGRTPFPWYYDQNKNRGFFTVYSNSLSLVFAGEPLGAPYVITIEYTKTTDAATDGISTTALMDAYEEGVNEA